MYYTPSKHEEEPPFLGEFTEDKDEHEVEHDSLTQHPTEYTQEKIVHCSCHNTTSNLEKEQMPIVL